MNEKQAWDSFAKTGKIEDYIRYAQIKSQVQRLLDASGAGEGYGAGQDPGAYHPGTDGGGK